jgi:hypothetical protein
MTHSNQTGVVTLTMSLVLLTLVTMVSVYTSRTVLFEQKIVTNDFRERQAFEAAESGMTIAISYLSSAGGADKDGDGVLDPVFDTDLDGIGDANVFTFSDNSSVTVTMGSVGGAFPIFLLQSVGVSDDQQAMRTVRSIGSTLDALPNAPSNPLTNRGTVIIGGSATVHNPEGNSTIWSGGDVDLGSNNSTATNIANPTDAAYPTCMDTAMTCTTTRSSSKAAVGLDVLEYDTMLSNLSEEQLFQNFFGMSSANYRASRVSHEVAAANVNNTVTAASPGVDLAGGGVIWVEGDTALGGVTAGCEVALGGNALCPAASQDPVIMIINGDLTTSGRPNITGFVFVMGDITLGSSTTVMGAMVVGGNTGSAGGGSLDIWYNSDVLDAARNNGPLGGTPGSWQDW